MKTPRNRPLQSFFPGTDKGSALWLVDQLNELESNGEAGWLRLLVHDLKEMARLSRKRQYRSAGSGMVGNEPRALWQSLNARLKEIGWSPYLWPPSAKKQVLTFRWGPRDGRGDQLEAGVAFNLAAAGLLARVRQCKHCKKRWLFAIRMHHRFCSEDCRKAYFGATPLGRKRNREYVRGYRKRKTAHDEAVLRRARRETPSRKPR